MTDNDSSSDVTKLLIDDASDFGFHAAYLVYSKAWAENLDEKIRLELNEIILSLAENREEYPKFYQKINQFRKNKSNAYSDRVRFKTQRKRDWRRNEAKKMRISRHKK